MKRCWLLVCSYCLLSNLGSAQPVIRSLDDAYALVEGRTLTGERIAIRTVGASKAKTAALMSIPEVSGALQFSYTRNTQLPVSFFPAEIFGGTPGTYREVQTGIPYVTSFAQNLDIRILNLAGWENLRLSGVNERLVQAEGKRTIQQLKEQVAAAFFNIQLLLKNQRSTEDHFFAVKTLYTATEVRFRNGLVNQQALNDATSLVLETESSLHQLQNLVRQEINGLKKLCDFPPDKELKVEPVNETAEDNNSVSPSIQTLAVDVARLQTELAKRNYRQVYLTQFPTISFFEYYGNQQFNTRSKIFDRQVDWIQNSYIGLKLSVPIPSANTVKQVSQSKYEYLLAKNTLSKEIMGAQFDGEKKSLEEANYMSQLKYQQQIVQLKEETFALNESLYKEGLTDITRMMDSFREMATAVYNLNASRVNLMLVRERIRLNNAR